jgi:uncharacterized protein YheU (UPF0270 family)
MSRVDDAAIRARAVEVPLRRVAADVLRRVAEEFVTRGGTDYGAAEKSLEEKVADVRRQLECGEAAVVYDAESQTINIGPKDVRGIVQTMVRSHRDGGQHGRSITQVQAARSETEGRREGERRSRGEVQAGRSEPGAAVEPQAPEVALPSLDEPVVAATVNDNASATRRDPSLSRARARGDT